MVSTEETPNNLERTNSDEKIDLRHRSPIENLLPLFDSIKWVASSKGGEMATAQYASVRRSNWLMIIFAPLELVFLSIILFFSQLPWPEWFLNVLYKIDAIVVSVLNEIVRLIEWGWNVVTVSFMRVRQTIEDIVDFTLSLCIFILFQVYSIYAAMFKFALRTMRVIFYPWIRLAEFVISLLHHNDVAPPARVTVDPATSTKDADSEGPSSPGTNANSNNLSPPASHKHIPDMESDDSETDHSLISEYNTIGNTDRHGRTYTRTEMTLAPDGRLKVELYKHVRGQLKVMRKNSIKFTRDMATFAKEILEPKMAPIKAWLYKVAKTLNLVSLYEKVEEEVKSRPYLEKPLEKLYSILKSIAAMLKPLTRTEKRSKRTRSSRSESLRRRIAASTQTPTSLGPSALLQSAEPTSTKDDCFLDTLDALPKPQLNRVAEDDESHARDSALASSVDDLYIGSDDTVSFPQITPLRKGDRPEKELKGNVAGNGMGAKKNVKHRSKDRRITFEPHQN